MDARVGPDWLFDYTSLFKSFNMFLDGSPSSTIGSKTVIEDEDEEVVYRPHVVSSTTPTVDAFIPTTCPESLRQQNNTDVDVTPVTPDEREFMFIDSSTATQTFMELLFSEQIANKFMASPSEESGPSEVDHSADDGFVNIHNLPVSLNDISQELPSKIQRDNLIENVIGQLGDGVRTRS